MNHTLRFAILLMWVLGVYLTSYAQSAETTEEPASTIMLSPVADATIPSTRVIPTATLVPTLFPTVENTATPTSTSIMLTATDEATIIPTSTVESTASPTLASITPTITSEAVVLTPIPESTVTPTLTNITSTVDSEAIVLLPITETLITVTPTLVSSEVDITPTAFDASAIDASIPLYTDYPYVDPIENTDDWIIDGTWAIGINSEKNSYWELAETSIDSTIQNTTLFAPVSGFDVFLKFSSQMDGLVSGGQVEASHDGIDWFVLGEVASSAEWTIESIHLFNGFSKPIYIRFAWLLPSTNDPIATLWLINQIQVVSLPQSIATVMPTTSPSPTLVEIPSPSPTLVPIDFCQFDKVEDHVLTIDDIVILRTLSLYEQSVDIEPTVFNYDLNRDGIFNVLDLQMMTQYMDVDCHTISLTD